MVSARISSTIRRRRNEKPPQSRRDSRSRYHVLYLVGDCSCALSWKIVANVKRQKKRRLRLLSQSPYCYWCGREVREYPHQKQKPDDMATIDHLRPRAHPERLVPSTEIPQTVLACNGCNSKRNAEFTASLGLEELHRRASHR